MRPSWRHVLVAGVAAIPAVGLVATATGAQTGGTGTSSTTTSTTGGSVTIQATCSVTSTGSGIGAGTWRNAVGTATGGGCSDGAGNQVINVQAALGTITLNAGAPTYNGAQPLIVNGNGVTIDGGGNNRIITLSTGALTTINNVTFTNGSVGNRGGAIRATGPLTVNGSTFSANSGGDGGGAISVDASPVIVNNSTFQGNHAQNGVNSNGGDGGAIRVHGSGHILTISGSAFTGNAANSNGFGGAFWLDLNGTATITNSLFTGNTAQGDGGVGFISGASSSLTAVGSTFNNNKAGSTGNVASGGAFEVGGTVSLTNSTVTGNSATNFGGGVDANIVKLAYTDVDGNTAPHGSNVSIGRAGSLAVFATVISNPLGSTNCNYPGTPAATSSGYNYVSDTSCFPGGGAVAAATDKIVPGGDPQLGAVANNGGPTPTQLPAATSALIDAIPVSACQTAPLGTGVTTDQRGVSRPQGAGCDIGAVEVAVVTAIVVTPRFTG